MCRQTSFDILMGVATQTCDGGLVQPGDPIPTIKKLEPFLGYFWAILSTKWVLVLPRQIKEADLEQFESGLLTAVGGVRRFCCTGSRTVKLALSVSMITIAVSSQIRALLFPVVISDR